jgi:hypothetical protein
MPAPWLLTVATTNKGHRLLSGCHPLAGWSVTLTAKSEILQQPASWIRVHPRRSAAHTVECTAPNHASMIFSSLIQRRADLVDLDRR